MNAPACARANAYLCLVQSAPRPHGASRDEPVAARSKTAIGFIEEAI